MEAKLTSSPTSPPGGMVITKTCEYCPVQSTLRKSELVEGNEEFILGKWTIFFAGGPAVDDAYLSEKASAIVYLAMGRDAEVKDGSVLGRRVRRIWRYKVMGITQRCGRKACSQLKRRANIVVFLGHVRHVFGYLLRQDREAP